METTHNGKERRQHGGIYGLVSLGRGRKVGYINCPFCQSNVTCFLWSVSGGGKKCKCGALLYRESATK